MPDTPAATPPAPATSAAPPWFAAAARPVSVGSHTPFLLDDDSVWLVEAGQVDVFSVRVEGRRPTGHRSHLFRVEAGRALFGLDAVGRVGPRGLLAVGTSGTRLLRAPRGVLAELAREPEQAPTVGVLLDGWIEALCEGIARDVLPKRCADLEPGQEVSVPAQTSARPRSGVCWIRHIEGQSLLLGKEGLTVNGRGFTPLAGRAWVRLPAAGRLHLVDTRALLGSEDLWVGLGRLHELVLACTALMADQLAETERERVWKRVAADQSALARACSRLAAAMQTAPPALARAAPPESLGDAVYAACQLIGDALGIPIKPPPAAQGTRDPLGGVLRASRIRARSIALREDWWHHDHGPLLGYIAADKHPVALLPTSSRRYLLRDPMAHVEREVTRQVAETLAPFAYVFYRPFPDGPLQIRTVLRFGFRGCRQDLVALLLTGSAAALLGMVPSVVVGTLFNTLIPGAQRSQVLQMTVLLLVSALAGWLFTVTRSIALLRIESRMGAAIQVAVWDRLLSLPLPFFRPYAAGDLATRAMSIDAIRQLVSGSTVTALIGGLFSLGNFGLMFYYSPTLAWRATLLIAVALAVTGIGSYAQLRPQRSVFALQAKTSGLVLQLLTSVAKLRVAGAEVHAFALWAKRFGAQRQLQFRARQVANVVAAFNAGFPVAAFILIFWVALPLISPGQSLRTGDFLAFLSAFTSCLSALLATFLALLSTLNTVPLYEQAKPILDAAPEVDLGKADPGILAGDLEMQHAVFRYQSDGPVVLRDLTFHIRSGEFVAIVGPSGSGKSTVLRLLLGFEKLESGSIYYDGQEIGGLDVQALRRQIGVVWQNGRLMSGDIFTNIVASAPVSLEEAWEAAEMAGFADDIRSMPMGMHTVISEGGGTLSGGQRQRLMIARAIVHRPRILLFDEATSALDNRTQMIVSASLERLQATRVVVAHRLSTIVHADRVFVMTRGRIVESGTVDELMRHGGLFTALAKRQLV